MVRSHKTTNRFGIMQASVAVTLVTMVTSMSLATVFLGGSVSENRPGESSSAQTTDETMETVQPQPAKLAPEPAIKSVVQRFASPTDEAPDFQRHVGPLLGRLGCNGRACHGSFQGRGGFQLSLFGYDFDGDHKSLLDYDAGRVDIEDPEGSLLLTKPTDADDHEGGLRYEVDSWEYNLLKGWVENGAKKHEYEQRLERLSVTPNEIILRDPERNIPLKVVAHWGDGTSEDVTPLARFQTNDPQIANVDSNGVVSTNEFGGDTHVVVFYDNAVAPVPVLHPLSDRIGSNYPNAPAPTKIDQLVVQKLRKLGIRQSRVADDTTFLRRVSLDMTGTLPSPNEIRAFVANKNPNKRSQKIESLLESPAYAAWWTTFLCDTTGNNSVQLRNLSVNAVRLNQQWYEWIEKRVAENVPYDQIVEGIVLAGGRAENESYTDYCSRMTTGDKTGAEFAEQDEMPYFWMRREFQEGEVRAVSFAHAFMGIRIQCAQCHKHPFDQWTQQDFQQFSRFFTGVSLSKVNRASKEDKDELEKLYADLGIDSKLKGGKLQKALAAAANKGKVVPFPELKIHEPKLSREELRAAQKEAREQAEKSKGKKSKKNRAKYQKHYSDAILLGSESVDFDEVNDVRQPVMNWLRSADNPYFAKALVNRVWKKYFGVGIVDPADDLNLANPPSNAALLDYLSQEFVRQGFDLKWLHREIANSRTYQLSWETNATNENDRRNFSRALPRRLPAEVVYDAISQATSNRKTHQNYRTNVEGRAIALAGTQYQRSKKSKQSLNATFAMKVFGRSVRETNCDCDRSEETSLIQSVYLQNDRDVYKLLADPSGWIAEVQGDSGPALSDKQRKQIKEYERRLQQLKDQRELQRKRGNERKYKNLSKQIEKMVVRLQPLRDLRKKKLIEKSKATVPPKKMVEEAYLRTLSRFPTRDEEDRCLEFLKGAPGSLSGMKGVVWALLNTKEFVVNH